ncbi:golgi-associated plant pathogenesis-related protein 1 [Trichonephila inaurata madagascariensis]|uniref:Golgi-associated plant pathogenesis-related protein 1 n=1 Tax=Trichonephila inaurata madagascariensis TaxID=2747483 RepID=A0A8X7CL09_9ARAC|nr:golgi-associated plant pathogenesis-related protein 1 [Trichonephila inaurata madagascariensis]
MICGTPDGTKLEEKEVVNSSLFVNKMEATEEVDSDSCFLPPANSVSLDVEDFRRRMILAHNGYRNLHGSPKLKPLRELEDDAQIWAETIAAKGYLQYCEKLYNIGESLSSIELLSTEPPSAERIVHNWYLEIKNYSFAEPRWRRGAFHFSQLVWRNTTNIGIGIAPVPGEPRLFIVVRYFPTGNSNFPGEFEKNVRPRISKGSLGSLDESSFLRTYSRSRSFIFEDAYI